jgi:tRNA (adenine37-N6)-methyltransferase
MEMAEDPKGWTFRESRSRSLVKSLAYRIVSIAGTGILTWIITGDVTETVSITASVQVFLAMLYYSCERLWNKISWGRQPTKQVVPSGEPSMNEISCKPIGLIRSPFKEPTGTPIQSLAARDVEGTVEIDPEFADGLRDIEGFSRLILIYYFHLCGKSSLLVKPFLDNQTRGVFATRAPARPNPIGVSIVRLVRVEGTRLHIKDMDVVDGTPLLDVKPYIPDFDVAESSKVGWYKSNLAKLHETKDDGRFSRR